MHRDAIYCCWGKQDAKSPFSGMHGVRNVQETSSLRPLGKQGQFWYSFAELLLPLGYQPELEGREAGIFPFSSVFPVLEIPLSWRSYEVTIRSQCGMKTYVTSHFKRIRLGVTQGRRSRHTIRRKCFVVGRFCHSHFFPDPLASFCLELCNDPKTTSFHNRFWKLLETSGTWNTVSPNIPEPSWTTHFSRTQLIFNAPQCLSRTRQTASTNCWHGKMYKTCKGYLWKSQCTKRLTPSSTIPIFFDSWWWEPLLENACLEHLVTATMNDFKHVQKFITPQLCSKIRL